MAFDLNVYVTGLCVIGYGANELQILMPATGGTTGIDQHNPAIVYDASYEGGKAGTQTTLSLAGFGCDLDTGTRQPFYPTVPKDVLDLTDTFGETIDPALLAPDPMGRIAARLRLTTGRATGLLSGNCFRLTAGASPRYLGFALRWTMKQIPGPVTITGQSFTSGATINRKLTTQDAVMELVVLQHPAMMQNGALNPGDEVPHFQGHYKLLGINSRSPTFDATGDMTEGWKLPYVDGAKGPFKIMLDAYRCMPTSASL